jgi:hypothetical protein
MQIGAQALRATAATNARDRQAGRHCQGAAAAGPRQYRRHAHLRSPPHPAAGWPDVQGRLLSVAGKRVDRLRVTSAIFVALILMPAIYFVLGTKEGAISVTDCGVIVVKTSL